MKKNNFQKSQPQNFWSQSQLKLILNLDLSLKSFASTPVKFQVFMDSLYFFN